MTTMINWNDIITGRTIPASFCNLKIEKADLVNNSYDGCLQINLHLRIVEPEVVAGRKHMEFLKLGQVGKVIGEEHGSAEWRERMAIDDPDFQDPRIQQNSKELKRFKRILECSGFPFPAQSSLEEVVAASVGQVFTGHMTKSIAQFGKNKGEEVNVLGDVFPLGVETPRLDTEPNKAASSNGRTQVPKPRAGSGSAVRPRPVIAPQIDEEEVEY